MGTRRTKTIGFGVLLTVVVLLIAAYALNDDIPLPDDVREAMERVPEKPDYNLHVKKILSDKCFSCHGPDSKKQKGDLRLDVAEVAYSKTAESGLKAIVPGKLSKSELVRRILSNDPNYLMPTPESHLQLSAEEKAILLNWIEDGARYKPHWAFVAPQKPVLPKVQQKDWIRNEIDAFVLSVLEQESLQPSPEADKETLIRRVSFDLTGLPPTIDEVDAFVNDPHPDAYEKMVDRYLASPRYGERMAAYWLDVARFADSHGYLDDKHRDASPWRDWVIQAYNKNLPFDQFLTWQLAGDLLPNASKEQILATGFNRNQKQNTEAGIIPEEFRVEYNVDRTNTLGAGILGLTLSCAKCHDHKYDPVSQKDYYSLYAFFNSTFELGSSNYGGYTDMVPGPTLMLTSQEQDNKIDSLSKVIRYLEAHKKPAETEEPALSLSRKLIAHLDFDNISRLEHKAVFINRANMSNPAFTRNEQLGTGLSGKSLMLDEETMVNFKPYGLGYFERYEPFAISIWVKVPKTFEESAILHHSDPRRYGFQGYDILLRENKINFRLMHAFPHDAISVISDQVIFQNEWQHITVSYDGSSRADGIRMYLNGKEISYNVEYDALRKNIRSQPDIHKTSALTGLTFGYRTLEKTMKGGELDEFSLYNDALHPTEVLWIYQQRSLSIKPNRTTNKIPDELTQARMALSNLYDTVREAMVMGDLSQPVTTRVLVRGNYDSYGDTVEPGTPAAVLPFPKHLPKNRLGLAQWLFLPENPLTARIAVNRTWELLFGRGLVKTSDDFGNQGEMPSHPELLDYLSVTFRENGWDQKALQKKILMSATYRQQSVITKELLEKDPENKLLARSSRYRMPAEMIRDQALAIAGLLSDKIGGPSVYPYQPPGLWEALSDKSWRYIYTLSEGEDLFRRSIYTVVKRSSPPPYMLIFDAPDRNFCTVKRTVSSSPLQALALMNDPTFIEASKFVASHMIREGGSDVAARLQFGFRLVTGRKPDVQEQKLLAEMYQTELSEFAKQPQKAGKILSVGNAAFQRPNDQKTIIEIAAYTNVAMALLNTDEFITRK